MMRPLSRLLGMTGFAAALYLAVPAWAGDDSCPPLPPPAPFSGPDLVPFFADNTGGYHYRGLAITSPLESPDGHSKHYHPKGTCVPYYDSPLTPISCRWCQTDCHGNPLIVPYYRGYCRWFSKVGPIGIAGNLAECAPPGPGGGGYGPYTGAPRNQSFLLRLGGNGLLPFDSSTCGPPVLPEMPKQ